MNRSRCNKCRGRQVAKPCFEEKKEDKCQKKEIEFEDCCKEICCEKKERCYILKEVECPKDCHDKCDKCHDKCEKKECCYCWEEIECPKEYCKKKEDHCEKKDEYFDKCDDYEDGFDYDYEEEEWEEDGYDKRKKKERCYILKEIICPKKSCDKCKDKCEEEHIFCWEEIECPKKCGC